MVGVYSTYRALGKLMGQERYYDPRIWGPSMVVLRYLSILENCKYSPLFKELIDFVRVRDKYHLGIDIPGFFDDISSLSSKAMEHGLKFGQYKEDGDYYAGIDQ